jgi:hypothetical protein
MAGGQQGDEFVALGFGQHGRLLGEEAKGEWEQWV